MSKYSEKVSKRPPTKTKGLKKKRSCGTKTKHKTREAAEFAVDNTFRSRKIMLSAYECEFCGAWHVGKNVRRMTN